jgi:hypothetical protein
LWPNALNAYYVMIVGFTIREGNWHYYKDFTCGFRPISSHLNYSFIDLHLMISSSYRFSNLRFLYLPDKTQNYTDHCTAFVHVDSTCSRMILLILRYVVCAQQYNFYCEVHKVNCAQTAHPGIRQVILWCVLSAWNDIE